MQPTAPNEIIVSERPDLASANPRMHAAGQAANHAASQNVFVNYKDRRAKNTIRRQNADLALFAEYYQDIGVSTGDFSSDPLAWSDVTWGIVEGFVRWQLKKGYAIGSINARLSTVKTYAKLAAKAGAIDPRESILIGAVSSYSRGESIRVNEKREAAGIDTRKGTKKAVSVSLTNGQARALKAVAYANETPQSIRDFLLICLLIDHGLRISEVADLTRQNFDLEEGTLSFYRKKTNTDGVHHLTKDTRLAAERYLTKHAPAIGNIWHSSLPNGELSSAGMGIRSMRERVGYLGSLAGIGGLSPHDCRHFAATYYAEQVRVGKMTFKDFLDIFGWKSPAMAIRYIESRSSIDVGEANINQLHGHLF